MWPKPKKRTLYIVVFYHHGKIEDIEKLAYQSRSKANKICAKLNDINDCDKMSYFYVQAVNYKLKN